jgi:hypothetical protein
MDGEAYLRRLAETWLQERGRASEHEQEFLSGLRLQEIEAAGRALVAAGAISAERLGALLGDLRRLLIDRGIIEELSVSMGSSMEIVAAKRDPGTPIPKEWTRALDQTPPELVRVVPIERDLGPVNDGNHLLLISLEVWTDRFGLRYASAQDSPRDRREFPRVGSLLWDATDDLGTPYRHGGGGGGGGRPWFLYTADFFPAIPAEAKELSLVAKPFGSDQESFRTSISVT